MKKYYGYIRVSSQEQARSGLSIENQERKIRLYAEMQDIELIDIIKDEGKSGKNLKRDGIQKILKSIKNKDVSGIIIYKLDRLTRSLRDLNYLIELFNKKKISLCSVKDSLDTETASGRMVVNLLGCISQWEREAIAERTSDALQEKKAQGLRYGNAPYGKAIQGQNIIDNPDEMKILQQITNLRKQGTSYQKIADSLNQHGYRNRKGSPFNKQGIHSILQHAA